MTSDAQANSPLEERRTAVDDWRGLGDLVELATERVAEPVEGVHNAVADRWFRIAGAGAAPRSTYRTVTRTVYNSVRIGGSVAGSALGIGAAALSDHKEVKPLWDSRLGSGVQATTNALWGDEFATRGSPMHTELGIRDHNGVPVRTDADSLADSFPSATSRVVVLIHGLGHTENCWAGESNEDETGSNLPDTLRSASYTPVFVRYNTGLRVSDNCASLAHLLEKTAQNWPVPIDEVAIVGHSMGGLIARSSVAVGRIEGHSWVRLLEHVVSLAAPHHGSPIEKGVHLASRALDAVVESRPIAEFVNKRSVGIKDMRFGPVHEKDQPASTPRVHAGECEDDGVDHHLAAGVITANSSHPVGFLLGDLVVRVRSAIGTGPTTKVTATNTRVFGGATHAGLLKDPAVHSQILDWLTRAQPASNE